MEQLLSHMRTKMGSNILKCEESDRDGVTLSKLHHIEVTELESRYTLFHCNLAKRERFGPFEPVRATEAKHVTALTKGTVARA